MNSLVPSEYDSRLGFTAPENRRLLPSPMLNHNVTAFIKGIILAFPVSERGKANCPIVRRGHGRGTQCRY